ncbi:MAG: peptidase S1 [Hyphomonadaceae bacterium]
MTAALGFGMAAPAAAQNVNAAPAYGSVNLVSGFQPDPYLVNINAGGSISAGQAISGCAGFIANAPDFRLNFTAGQRGLPLILSVAANADTTLVVNLPNGQWICDDDGGNIGMNPSIVLSAPMGGQYDIWVGTYAAGAMQPSTLHISEVSSQ